MNQLHLLIPGTNAWKSKEFKTPRLTGGRKVWLPRCVVGGKIPRVWARYEITPSETLGYSPTRRIRESDFAILPPIYNAAPLPQAFFWKEDPEFYEQMIFLQMFACCLYQQEGQYLDEYTL